MSDPNPIEPKSAWFEPVVAILMAVTTLGTAWCSYESAKWNGESSGDAAQADRLERHAAALHFEGNQIMNTQITIFMGLIDAQLSGNEKVANFYSSRLGGELRKAYDAWLEQKPFENPKAAPHPFVPELYQPRFTKEVKEALTDAARHSERAKKKGSIAATYLANTVLFAMVLFFAGAAGKFDSRRVRLGALFFAIAVFLFAFVRMVTLPVTGRVVYGGSSKGLSQDNRRNFYGADMSMLDANNSLPRLEIARVLVRFDDVASRIVNADHCIVRTAVMICVTECIADRIFFRVHSAKRAQNGSD